MIEKLRIRGYRKFEDLIFKPAEGMNILVGDNESGKSTIVEAINLAMTGRINGRPASEEINPYWFNQSVVQSFFVEHAASKNPKLPTISIEIFLVDEDELQKLAGAHNSDTPTRSCPGVELAVEPNPEYAEEIAEYLKAETSILPVEYYKVTWRTFGDRELTAKPRELTTALIDARTIRSTSGVDFHLRQMLSDHLDPKEKAQISVAYRGVKEKMTNEHLADVNTKMAKLEGALDGKALGLAMDQSSRSSWDASVSPFVADLPFAMAGLGQQVAVKIGLAMSKSSDLSRVVSIEEPENHLSFTSLTTLIARIDELRSANQQLFVTTHSSFVLNRLGLNALKLVSNSGISTFDDVSDDTVAYFKKLPGYDTLRLVLARKVVLVEGPSDEILFERFYKDAHDGRRPVDDGIDVFSMRGLSLKRLLELAKVLDRECIALRDNDGENPAVIRAEISDVLDGTKRELFIGAVELGHTLEPQLISANEEQALRSALGVTPRADLLTWMTNNKTEGAIRLAEYKGDVKAPAYMAEAIKFFDDEE